MALGKFKVAISADLDGVKKSVGGLGGLIKKNAKADGIGKTLGKNLGSGISSGLKGSLKGMGKLLKGGLIGGGLAVGAGVVGGTAALGAFGKAAIEAQANIEQALGGADAVFQGNSGEIKSWAASAAASMGISTNAALETANVMGSLYQGSGHSIEKSTEMTMNMSKRAADVASIMGVDLSSAMDAVTGAAKGNYEMMDNLGVSMNQTSLAAYAAEMGLEGTWASMSEAQKTGVAYQMFMDKTAQYAGNFEKENQTLAGSFDILRSSWGNILQSLGDPAMLEGAMDGMGTAIENVFAALKKSLPPLLEGMATLFERGFPKLLEIVADLAPELISLFAGITPRIVAAIASALPKIISSIAGGLGGATDGISGALEGVVQNIIKTLGGLLNSVIPLVQELIPAVIGALSDLLPQVGTMLDTAFEQLGALFAEIFPKLGEMITPALGQLGTAIGDMIPELLGFLIARLSTLIPVLGQLIVGLIQSLLPGLLRGIVTLVVSLIKNLPEIIMMLLAGVALLSAQIITELLKIAWAIIVAIFDAISPNLLGQMGSLLGKVFVWLGEAAVGLLGAAVTFFMNFVTGFGQMTITFWETLSGWSTSLFSRIIGFAGQLLSTAFNLWWNIVTAWVNFQIQFWTTLAGFISSLLSRIIGWGGQLLSAAASAFSFIVSAYKTAAQNLWNALTTAFGNLLDWITGWGSRLKNGAKTIFDNAVSAIVGVVSGLWGKIRSFFTDIPGNIISAIGDLSSIGRAMIEGIWKGISGAGGWLKDKIGGFGGEVVSGFKSVFRIGSPSKVMADQIGFHLGTGVALGLDNSLKKVLREADVFSSELSDRITVNPTVDIGTEGGLYAAARSGIDSRMVTVNQTVEKPESMLDLYLLAKRGASAGFAH